MFLNTYFEWGTNCYLFILCFEISYVSQKLKYIALTNLSLNMTFFYANILNRMKMYFLFYFVRKSWCEWVNHMNFEIYICKDKPFPFSKLEFSWNGEVHWRKGISVHFIEIQVYKCTGTAHLDLESFGSEYWMGRRSLGFIRGLLRCKWMDKSPKTQNGVKIFNYSFNDTFCIYRKPSIFIFCKNVELYKWFSLILLWGSHFVNEQAYLTTRS